MLNLLGCDKENFKKLLQKMNYKITQKNGDIFFRYFPKKERKKNFIKKGTKASPFEVLKNLSFNQ